MNESSLSLWELIANASVIVQMVMLLLVILSFASWLIILMKAREISESVGAMGTFEKAFWSGLDLRSLNQSLTESKKKINIHGIESIFIAGFQEFLRLQEDQTTPTAPDAILEGAERNMQVALSREEEHLSGRLPFLATVGSTSPYIGLFGTVWGIMNSFRSLAGATQVSLPSVAPGISEALVATAMGLLAAIPAVIAYNRLSTRVDSLVGRYQTFIEEFISLLHRRLHAAVVQDAKATRAQQPQSD